MEGTSFQKAVWEELKKIPFGQTTTYGNLAKAIACQRGQTNMSAQAIGQAVGANPIAIIVPCHRVVGKSGNLTGYAGGIERKKALLDLEKKALTRQNVRSTPKPLKIESIQDKA